jgi:voltage-gated potassium channel
MNFLSIIRHIPPHLKTSIFLLFMVFLTGTVGFHLLEKKGFVDSLYWTVTTMSTVGFGDVVAVTPEGKIFSIFIIISGVSVTIYTFTALMVFSMEGELKTILGVKKMQEKIDQLKGHLIVCGYGKVGKNIVATLIKENIPFVVLEKDHDALELLMKNNILHIDGDATYGETLDTAGIKRGKVLISCLSHDADNLYVLIEAKEKNPEIHIILRASRPESVQRFRKLGADTVILPEEAGAIQMTAHALEYLKKG